VRALWAGLPFVWQAYPQEDGAHLAKLEALLARWDAPPDVAALWRAWNGATGTGQPDGGLPLPPLEPWCAAVLAWRRALLDQPDLCNALIAFASGKARTCC